MNEILKILIDILVLLYYWFESIILSLIPRSFRFKPVNNELVLITGGGSGLGRLLAMRFARLGARVVLWDLNKAGVDETIGMVKAIKGQAYGYVCDVTDRNAVYETADRVRQEVGIVTILVNNAGIVSGRRFLDIPDDKIVKTFEVNAISHFWTLKAFLPDMMANSPKENVKGRGHLVTIASLAGLQGCTGLADYCASKFAAVGLEEALRLELQSDGYNGIHSTVVCPFFIDTGMFAGVSSSIVPILQPENVADQIMAAILTNQTVMIIPKMFYTLLWFKSFLPTKALYTSLNSFFGFTQSMNSFQGRYGRNGVKSD